MRENRQSGAMRRLWVVPELYSIFFISFISLYIYFRILGTKRGHTFSLKTLTYRSDLALKLAALVKDNDSSDVFVVLADEAIPVVRHLRDSKTAYISQGDLSLMFLNSEFRRYNNFVATLLEKGFVAQIRKHSKWVAMYDRIMANSEFTSNIMAYLYGIPISDVVYPPVDQEFFKPSNSKMKDERYALAMVRNGIDPVYNAVSSMTEKIPIKVIGGASVKGAQNLGFVSDEELLELYSGALFTLSPNTMEFYGYTIVESMSCSTPSLAYNNAGARELIDDGKNGWLARNSRDLMHKAINLYTNGYDNKIRENCTTESKRYNITQSTRSLLNSISEI